MCYCQWTGIVFSTAIFSTEKSGMVEANSVLFLIRTENELLTVKSSNNHVKKIVVCSKNGDKVGYPQWLRTSHMKAINVKN